MKCQSRRSIGGNWSRIRNKEAWDYGRVREKDLTRKLAKEIRDMSGIVFIRRPRRRGIRDVLGIKES